VATVYWNNKSHKYALRWAMCMEGSVYGVSRVGQPSASQVA